LKAEKIPGALAGVLVSETPSAAVCLVLAASDALLLSMRSIGRAMATLANSPAAAVGVHIGGELLH
jgi:hypothetical protein